MHGLPFRDFEFHGYTGERRVVSFGRQYHFSARHLRKADVDELRFGHTSRAIDRTAQSSDSASQIVVVPSIPNTAVLRDTLPTFTIAGFQQPEPSDSTNVAPMIKGTLVATPRIRVLLEPFFVKTCV